MKKQIEIKKNINNVTNNKKVCINFKTVFKNILIISLILFIMNIINTEALGKRKFLTRSYIVQDNDTVWKIASKICNNKNLDVQNVIYDIKDLNNIDNWNIYVGENIDLPIYD